MAQPLPEANFPGATPPGSDFAAIRSRQRTRPLFLTIDLSTARSIAAGTALQLPIAGNSIYVDPASSSGVCTAYLEGEDAKATPLTLFPGASFQIGYTYMQIENTAQPGSVLRLLYGVDIDFRPNNSAGVSILNAINVIDAGYQRTIAGQAFSVGGQQAASVGNLSHVQLHNPVGSGVNAVVRKIGFTIGAAAQVDLSRYDTQLTTDLGAASNKYASTPAVVTPTSQARNRSQANAALLGIGNPLAYWFDINAQRVVMETLTEPIVLTPGTGILFRCYTANIGLWGMFDWYEQAR
jgi:hypothetical protein